MRSTLFLLFTIALATAGSPARAADPVRAIDPDDVTGSAKAVVVGDVPLAHTTQLLPLDASGKLVGVGRPAVQADRVLDNLARALGQAQSGLDRLARLNVYLARADDLPAVQRALATRFAGKNKPAISTVVTRLNHPDARVAMDAVGVSATNPRSGVHLL
jgi:enamine deaminase RidA (YjgF/YER057c/UK114 family)